MNNALVIKNANFLTNKVTTVSFVIPCTGIEFDESSVTIDSMGTASVGYTKTPDNTTDPITITSSDTSVISVSGTTLTVNGIGETTLTITCGEYSDTCTAAVDIYENPAMAIAYVSTKTASQLGKDHDGLRFLGNSWSRLSFVGDYAKGYFNEEIQYAYIDSGFDPGQVTAIKIPANTKKIHIELDKVTTSVSVLFVDANQKYKDGATTIFYTPILSSESASVESGTVVINHDYTVPEGCDGYIVQMTVSPPIPSTITTEAALVEYVNTNNTPVIHYLGDSES